jgi:hypothetical protein
MPRPPDPNDQRRAYFVVFQAALLVNHPYAVPYNGQGGRVPTPGSNLYCRYITALDAPSALIQIKLALKNEGIDGKIVLVEHSEGDKFITDMKGEV